MKIFSRKKRNENKKASISAGIWKNNWVRICAVTVATFLIVGAGAVFINPQSNAEAAWYSDYWKFRKQITINESQVSGTTDLTNFTALIYVKDADLNANAQTDADDILFTSADGATKLDHEIQSYDAKTGELYAWVEIPTLLAQTNTIIYMYYGNTTASSQQNATGAWDANTRGLWHFDENTGTTADDETSNSNDLTLSTSSWTTSAKLKASFLGVGTNWASRTDDDDFDFAGADNFTISAWYRSSSASNPASTETLLAKLPQNTQGYRIRFNASGRIFFEFDDDTGESFDDSINHTTDTYDAGWHHVVAVKTGTSRVDLYVDGTSVASDTSIAESGSLANTGSLVIADRVGSDSGDEFNGDIDEVKIVATNRSADWIATEYNNQNSPSSFITPGSTQQKTEPVLHWGFDDGQGTTTQDSSGNNNDGTTNGPSWSTEDQCAIGKCLRFDGSNDRVGKTYSADTDLDPGTSGFTVSAWFKHVTSISGTDTIISRADGVNGVGYKIYMNSSGNICFGIDQTAGSFPVDSACSTTTYNDNRWHYVTGIKSGTSSITTYIDGKQIAQDASITASSISGSSSPLYVGIDADTSSNPWDGWIDEVKIYDFAKSAAQVQADFAARGGSNQVAVSLSETSPANSLGSGLIGYWKMDESAANSCTGGTNDTCDSSGNGNDGAWNGDATTTTTAKFSRATTYDGTGDYTQITDAAVLRPNNGSWSVSVWANPPNSNQTTRLISKSLASGTFEEYAMLISGNENASTTGQNLVVSYRESDSRERRVVTTADVVDGNWHNYTFVADKEADALRVYVDGVLQATTGQLDGVWPTIDNTDNLAFGARASDVASPYTGQIDEVRIYNRALTNQEVGALYEWAPGPVGYWKFDERSGTTAYDSSGNGITGTLNDGASWTTGKFGSAISFDGLNDDVSMGNSTVLDTSNSMTTMAWVKPAALGSYNGIVSRSCDPLGYYLEIENDGSPTQGIGLFQTGSATATADNVVTIGVWQHIAASVLNNNVTFYVNGVSVGSGAFSLSSAGSCSAFIGSYSGNDEAFNGLIDEVKIYNYARTVKQIIQDMNADHPTVGTPVGSAVGHWSFDEGYGTTANDTGPNDNDLTLSSASWTTSGKFDRAWNGTGSVWLSRADDNDFDFAAAEDFSVSMWFKSDSATNPASNAEYLISKGTITNTGTAGYAIYANTSGNIVFGVKDDTAWGASSPNTPSPDDSATSTSDIYDGTWHHIVATKTGASRINLYVDGKLNASDTSIAATATLANSIALRIGDDDADSANSFNGDLDEMKIYRSALTSEQVLTEFNQGKVQVLGARSTDSTGTIVDNSSARAYCVPGDTSTCSAPIAEWNFDESSGTTANDTTGNNNFLTLSSTSWSNGKIGNAFNGEGTVEVCSGSSCTDDDDYDFASSDNFTVSLWFKSDSATNPGSNEYIIGKHNASTSGWHIRVSSSNPGQIVFGVDSTADGTTSDQAVSTADLYDGTWHYISAVKTGTSRLDLYVDGKLDSSDTSITTETGSLANTLALYIADRSSGSTSEFTGDIDQVRIYRYARTPAQIAWDYNRGGPLAQWEFDECTGTTLNDSTGNGYSGTFNFGSGTYTSAGTCNSGTASHMWNGGSTGKFNSAAAFDGGVSANGDTHIRLSDNIFDTLSQGSIALWFKPSNSGDDLQYMFFGAEDDNGGGSDYLGLFIQNSTGVTGFDVRNNGVTALQGAASVSNYTQWHHLAFIVNSTGNQLYIDGTQVSPTYSTGNSSNTTFFDDISENTTAYTWGCSNTDGSDTNDCTGTAFMYEGLLDDIRVYNYPLTAAQVKLVYNQNSAIRFGP